MKAIPGITLGLFLVVFASPSGAVHVWSQRFGDTEADHGTSVAVDGSGNVVVTGDFRGTVNFGGGNLVSIGLQDGFVAKYNSSGTHQWSKDFAGTGTADGGAVAVDGSGNVVVFGRFTGTMNLGGSDLVGGALGDFFVVKYDANGAHLWSQSLGLESMEANGVAVDGSGNVVVAGVSHGALNEDIIVTKFDAGGVHQWSHTFDAGRDYCYDVAVDGADNVVITGSFQGVINFGGDDLVSAGDDVFIAKFDPDGIHLWSRDFGSTEEDNAGNAVAIDRVGNIVVAGQFLGTVDFGGGDLVSAGIGDVFLAKYDADGVHQWSQRFGGTSIDHALGVAVDGCGNVVVTGLFIDTINFGGDDLVSAGLRDIFLAAYDADGAHHSSQRLGGTDDDIGHAVAVDGLQNVVVTGSFNLTVDFGGGNLVSAGREDIFLAKYDSVMPPDTTPPTIDVVLNRDVLWPPNHKMVDVCASVTVTDGCDPAPTFVLVGITSDELDNDRGDGNTLDDIQGEVVDTPDLHYGLRSERQGGGDGRKYTITYRASDAAGNTTEVSVCVRVPHDQSSGAFASTGFTPDGLSLDPGVESFAVIIPTVPGVDATQVETASVFIGNTAGVIRPTRRALGDATNDGRDDAAFFFESAGAATISSVSDAVLFNIDGIDGALSRDVVGDGALGLHFVGGAGEDYLVANIFSLGTPIPISAPIVPSKRQRENPVAQKRTTELLSVHPNPFNPQTTVDFVLSSSQRVRIAIYDVRGSLVRPLVDETMPVGEHRVTWNGVDAEGRPASSGIYFVRMIAGAYSETRKIVMLK